MESVGIIGQEVGFGTNIVTSSNPATFTKFQPSIMGLGYQGDAAVRDFGMAEVILKKLA